MFTNVFCVTPRKKNEFTHAGIAIPVDNLVLERVQRVRRERLQAILTVTS